MSRFGGGNRSERKQNIIEKIKKFFEKYFGIFHTKKDDDYSNYGINDNLLETENDEE